MGPKLGSPFWYPSKLGAAIQSLRTHYFENRPHAKSRLRKQVEIETVSLEDTKRAAASEANIWGSEGVYVAAW